MGLQPIKKLALHVQVAQLVRAKIESGEYLPAARLPSTSQLAQMTGTSVFTVQTALSRLAKEGLLNRIDKRGTFVAGERPSLSRVAIYFNRPFYYPYLNFYSVLAQELKSQYAARGTGVEIFMDERPEDEQGTAPVAMRKAVEQRDIQAVLAPLIAKVNLSWLSELSVPVALPHGNEAQPNQMRNQTRDFLQLSLGALAEQGCTSVGVISSLCLRADGQHPVEVKFYRDLVDAAHDCGLTIQDEWLRFPQEFEQWHANFGHRQFLKLWQLPEKPDGLLVYPDVVASGVVMAALENRVRVPEDLKLVLHANDQLPYPCPLPAKFAVMRVAQYARAFRKMIQQQLEPDLDLSQDVYPQFSIENYAEAFPAVRATDSQKIEVFSAG
jgi:DNA-binding LacI/PurR family transcriptional regulator